MAREHGLKLVRLDGITRTGLDRVRRRYERGRLDFMLANATADSGRASEDIFSRGPSFAGHEAEFWSIAAVFRR
jgi:hypothetical protein